MTRVVCISHEEEAKLFVLAAHCSPSSFVFGLMCHGKSLEYKNRPSPIPVIHRCHVHAHSDDGSSASSLVHVAIRSVKVAAAVVA